MYILTNFAQRNGCVRNATRRLRGLTVRDDDATAVVVADTLLLSTGGSSSSGAAGGAHSSDGSDNGLHAAAAWHGDRSSAEHRGSGSSSSGALALSGSWGTVGHDGWGDDAGSARGSSGLPPSCCGVPSLAETDRVHMDEDWLEREGALSLLLLLCMLLLLCVSCIHSDQCSVVTLVCVGALALQQYSKHITA
jgi:hypothetical protein